MTTQTPKRLLLASLIAAASTFALAQVPAVPATTAASQSQAPSADGAIKRHQRWAQRRAEHQAALKAQLKLTPEQDAAWNAYVSALQPANPDACHRLNRDELAKLRTPERIDRLQALSAERAQRTDQRFQAIKTFYAQLSPEQQQVYDQQSLHGHAMGHAKRGHHRHNP